jgi:hypothetical protein
MHPPCLSKGAHFLVWIRTARWDHRRTRLGRNARAKFSESPGAEEWLGDLSVKSERLLRLGDSEKTSTISVRWEKLPS